MRTVKVLVVGIVAAMSGCSGSEPGDTEAGSEVTGASGTDATDPGSTGGETSSTSGTSTTHEHPTGTTHEHPTTGEHETTGEPASPYEQYCACMVLNCHDLYHETWGEDHRTAEMDCIADAEMVPSAGVPAMSGDSIECRLFHCQAGVDDAMLCAAAMGAAPCM